MNVIYDPLTTQTSADGKTITRSPFAGNVIPLTPAGSDRGEVHGRAVATQSGGHRLRPPQQLRHPLPVNYPYKNFADRVDYHASDKLSLSFRAQIFRTPVTALKSDRLADLQQRSRQQHETVIPIPAASLIRSMPEQ